MSLIVTLVSMAPKHSRAATNYYVLNLDDSGSGSLRQAIADSKPGDSVRFRTNGIIHLTSGEILITNSIKLYGPGATNLIISGNNLSRIFNFSAGVTSSISDLTIRDGRTADGITNYLVSGNGGDGGGIYNAGTLTVSRCVFTANKTGNGGAGVLGTNNFGGAGGSGGSGGALYNQGTLILNDCIVSTNATGSGGNGGPRSLNVNQNGAAGPGGTGGAGGSICNLGTLILTGCLFSGNSAGLGGYGGTGGLGTGGAGGSGGGIWNQHGTITMTACTLSGNLCGGGNNGGYAGPYSVNNSGGTGGVGGSGGGVGNQRGNITITSCTFSGNSTGTGGNGGGAAVTVGWGGLGGNGAGIWNDEGTMKVIASTISSNLCLGGGRGVYGGNGSPGGKGGSGAGIGNQSGILTVTACTLTGNSCGDGGQNGPCIECGNDRSTAPGGSGGGISAPFSSNAVVILQNTLIAQNSSGRQVVCCYSTNFVSGPDIAGTFNSYGYNLIGAGNGSTGLLNTINGDLVGTTNAPINPLLGPLQDNGGPTLTHALLAGSPAIDAGTNSGLALDQRGQPRTIDNPAVPNGSGGDGTDIGAVEVNHVLTATDVRRIGNDILVRFTSVSDKTYGVEQRSEIYGAVWIRVPITITGTGGLVTYTDADAGLLPRRFYRLSELP